MFLQKLFKPSEPLKEFTISSAREINFFAAGSTVNS
jgi:hypothetical protein